MKFEWILLAFFLVALIWGIVKAIKRPMLKNIVRLASVPVAFVITYALQLAGVFRQLVGSVLQMVNLAALIPALTDAMDFINALATTLVGPILFVIVFFVVLAVLRLCIFIGFKIADKAKAKKAEKAALPAQVSAAVEENAVKEASAESEAAPEAEAEQAPAEADSAEEKAPEIHAEETPKKKKKTGLPEECAWKRVVSVVTGAISGLLILAVVLMPIFYLMSVVTTAVDGIENSDADDSQVYKVVNVVDEYIASPYEDSFVASFYDTLALSDLMNSVSREGGKMVLTSGKTVYADDVLKSLIKHGVSAASQITSAKSEYLTIEDDLDALVSDPLISSVLADLIIMGLDQLEVTEPEEDDIIGGLTNTFLEHYKEADRELIEKDLKVIGKTVSALAKSGVLIQLVGGNADMEALLSDEENLGDVVGSISGLSAFAPTIEGAFELGIEVLGTTLGIPTNAQEAYGILVDHLIDASDSSNATFDYSQVESFIRLCISNGKQYTNNSSHPGYDDFENYRKCWAEVQLAFAHSGEDRSFGDFTVEIDGKQYILKSRRFKEIPAAPDDSATQAEKDKYNRDYTKRISPISDLIHYVTKNSAAIYNEVTLKDVLSDYLRGSSKSTAGEETAKMIVNADYSNLDAVTVEKMLAATDFTDWSDAEKESDSKKCVDIIFNLLGMMDMLGSNNGSQSMDDLVGQLGVVGETMDIMRETSCIKNLTPLMLEGLMANDIFADIPMYTAYNYNEAVLSGAENTQTGEPTTYTDIMNELLTMLGDLGGIIK